MPAQKNRNLLSSYETESIAKRTIELAHNEEQCMALSKVARQRAERFDEAMFEEKIGILLHCADD